MHFRYLSFTHLNFRVDMVIYSFMSLSVRCLRDQFTTREGKRNPTILIICKCKWQLFHNLLRVPQQHNTATEYWQTKLIFSVFRWQQIQYYWVWDCCLKLGLWGKKYLYLQCQCNLVFNNYLFGLDWCIKSFTLSSQSHNSVTAEHTDTHCWTQRTLFSDSGIFKDH